jgi:hypothetical protein
VTGAAPYTIPLLVALALAGPGCRIREQSSGPYAFTAASVEKDDCLLVPASGALPGGDFFSTGNWVQVTSDWYGMTLSGAYHDRPLLDDSLETFYADGSAQNVTAAVGDLQCALDVATAHLEGTTDSATSFHGTLRFRYEARQPPGCLCESWVTFQATHQ